MEKKIYQKLFREITLIFALTAMTLSLIVWILQAVNFLDIISEDGHSILTYFQFSLLNIPKILSKIIPLSFFLSLFYVLVSYDEKNQLLIYWSNGISKKNFLNKVFFFSFLILFFSIILSFFVVPFTQNEARSYIRNSSLDFFPSLIKPRQFIDTVENLTIFIDSKKRDRIKNIILKDSRNSKNIQLITAKEGKIINEEDKKYLILYDGKIINSGSNKNSTIFNFKETNFNLDKFKTKTTTYPKIQEINSFKIIDCLINLNQNIDKYYEDLKCSENISNSLRKELYKRIYLPLYIPIISIISVFLILNTHSNYKYNRSKAKVFTVGIFFLILSQVSVNFISEQMIINLITLSIVPLSIIILFSFFNLTMRSSS